MHESEFSALLDAIDEVVEHHTHGRPDLRTVVVPVPANPIAPPKVQRLRKKP
ncbi:MAG TPA: hypothetical protein VGB92_19960 [Longimicrobium sp.]|jgi:hypothetical protein